MQQVHTGENKLNQFGRQQVANHTIGTKIGGPVRHMVGALVRNWQRRKMIASLEAMDDWLLRDIGIDRADILDVVNGFDDRELLMAPLSTRQPAPQTKCLTVQSRATIPPWRDVEPMAWNPLPKGD